MELKIRVGASIDRSVDVAYAPLVEAAKKAATQIAGIGAKTGAAYASSNKRGLDQAEKNYRRHVKDVEKWERELVAGAKKTAADKKSTVDKEARDFETAEKRKTAVAKQEASKRNRENERLLREVGAIERREAQRAERDARSSVRRQNARSDSRAAFAGRVASYGLRTVGRIVGFGAGVANDIVRGMGVDTDVGSLVGKGVALESGAVNVSNQGYLPGHVGAAGIRQDPVAIQRQVRQAAIETGSKSETVMAGLEAFVAKTGDLATARDILKDSSVYAKAFGADLGDTLDAAGDISNALGDIPNKGEEVKKVLRIIGAQGKEGAVEIKDLAKQMAKLTGASATFTGDRETVLAQLGAVTQMSRAKGGSASATQAATSATSFANTFSKGARLDAFQAFGVKIRGADQRVDLREAIVGSIRAASSDRFGGMANFDRNMGKMFMDVRARGATRGYEAIFKEAGGGEEGLRAVERAFDDATHSIINETEVRDSFARAMGTTESKANTFNEELGTVANELKTNLQGPLEALAPVILEASRSFADWVGKVTGHTRDKNNKQDLTVEEAADVARGHLQSLLNGPSAVADETLSPVEKEVAKTKDDLKESIAERAARLKKDEERLNIGEGFGQYTDEKIRSKAASGNKDALNYVNDKDQLDRMTDSLERLTSVQQDLLTRQERHTLRVVIVGDTRPLPPSPGGRSKSPHDKSH